MAQPSASDTRKLLDVAAETIKHGRAGQGRAMLEFILEREPANVLALLWMTRCVETPAEKLAYFQKVLQVDPTNRHAIKGTQLYATDSNSAAGTHPAPSPIVASLRPCPFCHDLIPAGAATCPHCGRRFQSGSAPSSPEDALPTQLPAFNTAHKSPTSRVSLALVGLAVLFAIWLLARCGQGPSANDSAPRPADAAGQAAIRAVKNLSTPLADNMDRSVAVALAITEAQGHTASIDGWYVSNVGQYNVVSFRFFLGGEANSAEWAYYPDGTILPMTDWAFVFMGQ